MSHIPGDRVSHPLTVVPEVQYGPTARGLRYVKATEDYNCPDRERFLRGYNAACLGVPRTKCPYPRKDYAYVWELGYDMGLLI